MEYLILIGFRSYGKQFHKGDVVDESDIRSPGLRRAEGKIVPAVSSFTVPVEFDDVVDGDTENSQALSKDETTAVEQSEETEAEEEPKETETEEEQDKESTKEKPKLFNLSR